MPKQEITAESLLARRQAALLTPRACGSGSRRRTARQGGMTVGRKGGVGAHGLGDLPCIRGCPRKPARQYQFTGAGSDDMGAEQAKDVASKEFYMPSVSPRICPRGFSRYWPRPAT
jgi:hypothetical protein